MAISHVINTGLVKTIKASGGDYAITISAGTNLANGSGRISARIDMGALPRTAMFEWKAKCRFQTSPTLAAIVSLYWSQSDGTYVDGNIGTADAALSSTDKLNNLKLIGQILVDIANTTDYMQASGVFSTTTRYGSLVVRNAGGTALNDFEFVMTELIEQTVAF